MSGRCADGFYHLWVCHEAGVKATGHRLLVPADDATPGVWLHPLATEARP